MRKTLQTCTSSLEPTMIHQMMWMVYRHYWFLWMLIVVVVVIPCCDGRRRSVMAEEPLEASLNGRHLVFTVTEESTFLDFKTAPDGRTVLSYSGYLIDMLQAMARPDRANFTYELRPPSGVGVDCVPSLAGVVAVGPTNKTTVDDEDDNADALYGSDYWSQYNCATNDVELSSSSSNYSSTYRTDAFLGLFYASLDRLRHFQFTIPYNPPYEGTPAMFGTATGLPTIEAVAERQRSDPSLHVCVPGSTATLDMVRDVYPALRITELVGSGGFDDLRAKFEDGTCSIFLADSPVGKTMIRRFAEQGRCLVKGKPIGLIGEPMQFGLSHYAIGMSRELPTEVPRVLSYWMTYLMACNPTNECPDGNLATFYNNRGGNGKECGYVLYPPQRLLSPGAITGVTLGCLTIVTLLSTLLHRMRMRQQEQRYKKRFVQQIARNIEIGPSPGTIPPTKLSEEIMHISKHKGVIGKEDLRQWLLDIKMPFISDKDFDALWSAMDIRDRGVVDPVQFIVFLSACGPQFEQVYKEQAAMPKLERLKLAARRLSNINHLGEAGVRRLERRLENSSGSRMRRSDRLSDKPASSMSLNYDPSSIMSLDCHPSSTPLDKPPTSEGTMTAEDSGDTVPPPAVSGD